MIKPIELKNIPTGSPRPKNIRIRDIEAFIRSGANACEIITEPNETARGVYTCYFNAISRRQYYKDLVKVIQRNGRLFLIRTEGKRVAQNEE